MSFRVSKALVSDMFRWADRGKSPWCRLCVSVSCVLIRLKWKSSLLTVPTVSDDVTSTLQPSRSTAPVMISSSTITHVTPVTPATPDPEQPDPPPDPPSASKRFCDGTERRGISWPQTHRGATVERPCPTGTRGMCAISAISISISLASSLAATPVSAGAAIRHVVSYLNRIQVENCWQDLHSIPELISKCYAVLFVIETVLIACFQTLLYRFLQI